MATLRTYLLWSIAFLCGNLCAQEANEFHYEFGEAGTYLDAQLMPDGEQLIALGAKWDNTFSRYVITVDTIATNGQLLGSIILADSAGRGYQFQPNAEHIKHFSDESLYVSALINQGGNFLYRLKEGEVTDYWEYPVPAGQLSSNPRLLIPAEENGLYRVGIAQFEGSLDIQVEVDRIDSTGQRLWIRHYGRPNGFEFPQSYLQLLDGTIVIGAAKEADRPPGIPIGIDCYRNWIFAIDTIGNVLWEWEGEPCETSGVINLKQTDDGGYLYLSGELQVDFNASGGYGVAPYAVRRDADFNLIWQLPLADSYAQITTLSDLRPTPDGNYVGTGRFVMPEPYTQLLPGDFYPAACVFKFTPDGELLWRRCDTVTSPPGADSEAHYVALPLPSDSTITVGGYVLPGGARRGWITKLGPDGCREVVCDTLTPVTFPAAEDERYVAPEVYPNPAFTNLNVVFTVPEHDLRWQLYDAFGRLVMSGQEEFLPANENLTLDINSLMTGVYWLRLANRQGFLFTRTIVKGHL